jgi:2-dehydro-3-deoxyphosphogluconate aldolase / (4S)-4-hydroxy-2-oxoglutarate aldolase
VGGPNFVKSVLGPCPWTSIMPTGGVETTEESINAWFKAGVTAVGIGSNLVSKNLVASGDFAAISSKIKQVSEWIRKARSAK